MECLLQRDDNPPKRMPKRKPSAIGAENQEEKEEDKGEHDISEDAPENLLSRYDCHKDECTGKAFCPCVTCNRWLCATHAILAGRVRDGARNGIGDYVYACLPFHVPETFVEMEALIRKHFKGFSCIVNHLFAVDDDIPVPVQDPFYAEACSRAH